MKQASRRDVVEDEGAAPVTILDGRGQVVRIIPAAEFRRMHGAPERPKAERWRLRRERRRPTETISDATETITGGIEAVPDEGEDELAG